MFKSRRIGELLIREKKITPQQLQEALEEQKRQGGQPKLEPSWSKRVISPKNADFLFVQTLWPAPDRFGGVDF